MRKSMCLFSYFSFVWFCNLFEVLEFLEAIQFVFIEYEPVATHGALI